MADDPYTLLGLKRDATPEAIKAAYRKLARKHHPDLNPGKAEAEARFKAVSAANDLLSDPERRARFDRGEIDAEGQEQRPPGGARRHSESSGGYRRHSETSGGYRRQAETEGGERYAQSSPFQGEGFKDLFADLFEARRRADAAPRRGPDENYRLPVGFAAAVNGATEVLTLPDGRSLSVKIPPGVTTGQVLRLRGQGGAGHNGGPAGDAMIALDVAAHPLIRREGMDSHMDLPVGLKEAVLGGPVAVPTPSGAVRVTLPPHSDTGRQIRLRGKGVAAQGERAAGDMFLTLRVVIGPADAALEAFLAGWTQEDAVDPRAGMEVGA